MVTTFEQHVKPAHSVTPLHTALNVVGLEANALPLLRAAFRHSHEAFLLLNDDGRICFVSENLSWLLACAPEHFVHQHISDIIALRAPHTWSAIRGQLQQDSQSVEFEQAVTGLDARARHFQLHFSRFEAADLKLIAVNLKDISRDIKREQELRTVSNYDKVTGLANRLLFVHRLENISRQAIQLGDPVSLLYVDIQRFKRVNDSLGYKKGDILLQEFSDFIKSDIRSEDFVGRLGGNEFAILLPLTFSEQAENLAKRIVQRCQAPFVLGDQAVTINVNIGIASYPKDANNAESLLRYATSALHRAKREDMPNTIAFFEVEDVRLLQEKLAIEQSLRNALENDPEQFEMVYQARVDLINHKLCSVEALIRWRHPERGLLMPSDFIPIAEDSEYIHKLGRLVMHEVYRQAKAWQDKGYTVRVALNLSIKELQRLDIVEQIRGCLDIYGLDASLIELEITESAAMTNVERTLQVCKELKALGVFLAIDDFGTGYSSLNYLKRFPVDVLKIDKSFIQEIREEADLSRTDADIIRTIVALAASLGLSTIAEGVETELQALFVASLGCQEGQGYLLARPMSAEDFSRRFLP